MRTEENNSNSYPFSVDTYIYFENEEFDTKLFDKQNNFVLDIVRMQIYCSNVLSKMFYCSIGAEFLGISLDSW